MKQFILFYIILITIQTHGIEFTKWSQFSLSDIYDPNNSNLVIDSNRLYAINNRSFQIFDIEEENLQLIIELDLEGVLANLSVKDNYAHVSTTSYDLHKLYRINIENLENLFVTDTISFIGNNLNFINNSNIFIPENLSSDDWVVHVYDNNSFNEITQIDFHLFNAGDDFGINYADGVYSVYNITDPTNPNLISSDTLSYSHSQFFKAKIINNNYIIINMLPLCAKMTLDTFLH